MSKNQNNGNQKIQNSENVTLIQNAKMVNINNKEKNKTQKRGLNKSQKKAILISALGLCIAIASLLFGNDLIHKYSIEEPVSDPVALHDNNKILENERGMVKLRIYNGSETAMALNFENISYNDLKISGRGASLHPGQSMVLDLDYGNQIWKAKRFKDVTKSAETENEIYEEGLIRFNKPGEEQFLVIE